MMTSDTVFQIHFADVVDYTKEFDDYSRKFQARKEAYKDLKDFGCADEEPPPVWGPTRCTVLLCGRTQAGARVMARVKGFSPWFYIVDLESSPDDAAALKTSKQFEQTIMHVLQSSEKLERYVTGPATFYVAAERRKLVDGCEPNPLDGGATLRKFTTFRVCCPTIKARRLAVEAFETTLAGMRSRQERCSWTLAEHGYDVKPLVQFYSVTKLHPMAWVQLVGAKCKKVYTTPASRLTYANAIEVKYELDKESIVHLKERVDMAPMRVMVMDVEANSPTGGFPDPTRDGDAAIIVGTRRITYNVSVEMADPQGVQFCLRKTTEPPPGSRYTVRCFETEQELLLAYRDYIVYEEDPDFILHWNGVGFDNHFLNGRAEKLLKAESKKFLRFSVLKDKVVNLYDDSKSSNQSGDSKAFIWRNLFGRVDVDMMVAVKRDVSVKYRSYSLDYVASEMFGEHKIGITPRELWDNFEKDPDARLLNAEYCDQDCALPLKIEKKMQAIGSLAQMAAITRTEMSDIVYRGQTLKVFNLIHVYAQDLGFVVNHNTDIVHPKGYQGAFVLEPSVGYHSEPIAVLDFMSLYPSLMIEHNLCYSTELYAPAGIMVGNVGGLAQDQAYKDVRAKFPNAVFDCPRIDCTDGLVMAPIFYQNETGLLPMILKDVLFNRGVAKKNMSAAYKAGDSDLVAVYNGRQLALKVSANSVYGFTGALIGKKPRLTISATVTYYGRCGLMRTKDMVESEYTAEKCYVDILKLPAVPDEVKEYYGTQNPPAVVVGGDTDSVFVKFPVLPTREGLQNAIAIAKIASDHCTEALFKPPMELEYEKTYMPAMFLCKKHYGAGKFVSGTEDPEAIPEEQTSKWKQFIEMKGLETVRRDVPPFTSNLLLKVMYFVLIKRNPDAAYKHISDEFTRLIEQRVSYEEMMITSQLNNESSYANPDKLAHVQVVRRMRGRNPGSEPRTGDRVCFVYVVLNNAVKADRKRARGGKDLLAADFAEDLAYSKEHKLSLDLLYYFEHKIRKPLTAFLKALGPGRCEQFFEIWHDRITNTSRYKMSTITSFLGKRAAPVAVENSPCKTDGGNKRKQVANTETNALSQNSKQRKIVVESRMTKCVGFLVRKTAPSK